jgi:hypothetical protein
METRSLYSARQPIINGWSNFASVSSFDLGRKQVATIRLLWKSRYDDMSTSSTA